MSDQSAPTGEDELAVLEIAFAESVRKLGTVQDAAESIRSRSGTLMAVATAVGAFLGGLAIDREPTGLQWVLAAGGLVSYLTALAVLVAVLLPKKSAWPVGQNATALAGVAGKESLRTVLSQLAVAYQQAFDMCEEKVRWMAKCFGAGVGLMVIELLFFSCLLGLASQNSVPSMEELVTVPRPGVSTTQPGVSTTQPGVSTTQP